MRPSPAPKPSRSALHRRHQRTITITVVGANDPAIVDQGRGNESKTPLRTGGHPTVTDVTPAKPARPQSGQVNGSFTSTPPATNLTPPQRRRVRQSRRLVPATRSPKASYGRHHRWHPVEQGHHHHRRHQRHPVITPDSKTTPEDHPSPAPPDRHRPRRRSAHLRPARRPCQRHRQRPAGRQLHLHAQPRPNGPDSFTVTVSDGRGSVVTHRQPITVTPLNDDPVARNDANSGCRRPTPSKPQR